MVWPGSSQEAGGKALISTVETCPMPSLPAIFPNGTSACKGSRRQTPTALALTCDTQLTRLAGPNFHEIPTKQAIAPVHNMNRDGLHRQTIAKGRINYELSSIGVPPIREIPAPRGGFAAAHVPVSGAELRHRSETFADHYLQTTLLWQSQTLLEQQHIGEALQFELGKLTVQQCACAYWPIWQMATRDLVARVATVLGVPVPIASPRNCYERDAPSPALAMSARDIPKSIVGREVAMLAADGADGDALHDCHRRAAGRAQVPQMRCQHLHRDAYADQCRLDRTA